MQVKDLVLRKRMLISILIVIFFCLSFVVDSPRNLWNGYVNILKSESILVTDYLAIGGLGATLFNVATILLFNYLIIIHLMKLKITGPIFAGLLSIIGFSFFGKNIFNTIPIYLGIFIYAKAVKTPQRNFILSYLFATGLSPVVSYFYFGIDIPIALAIFLGTVIGVFVGFIVPSLAAHTIKFSQGYNILNTGFALGVISVMITSILNTIGIQIEVNDITTDKYHNFLLGLLILISCLYLISSFIIDNKAIYRYKKILHKSGRLVTDFIRDNDHAPTQINIALMGFLCVLLVIIFDIKITGPVFGSIIACMGFSAYGAHIKNTTPVILGVILMTLFSNVNFDNTRYVVTLFFSFGLAPIAGRYGFFAGLLSGVCCTFISRTTVGFQGGLCLYNTGFSAGFIAAIIIPVIESFRKEI